MSAFDEPLAGHLPDGMQRGEDALSIGGFPLTALAAEYGTPLYVYDETTLRTAAREAVAAFAPLGAQVSFAAKACALVGVLATFREEGLDLDVVSRGEIEAGLRAGFDPAQMHLHGNYKSGDELQPALELGLHAIVVDNLDELRRLRELATRVTPIWLRLALPVAAQTHPYLQTGGGSKFGFEPGPELEHAISVLSESPCLALRGLHSHLGSQLTDARIYRTTAEDLLAYNGTLRSQGMAIESISVGGGWAVPYSAGDPRLTPVEVAAVLRPFMAGNTGIRLAVEPGRALVARAAVAVYRAGSVKQSGGRTIVAVDGGMGDNPRPALYGARYTVIPVTTTGDRPMIRADIVGRYCESGDVLARDVELAEPEAGDLLCLPMAGAYQLSMASAYNLVPPPAAVMVGEEGVRLLQRRATVDDLLARDVWPVASSEKR